MEIICKECGHSITDHCGNESEIYPEGVCENTVQDIAAAAIAEARENTLKEIKKITDEMEEGHADCECSAASDIGDEITKLLAAEQSENVHR